MARRKTKYTMRPDGLIVMSKVVGGKRKYFYGKSDEEVEKKYAEYITEAEKKQQARAFAEVAADWWEERNHSFPPIA